MPEAQGSRDRRGVFVGRRGGASDEMMPFLREGVRSQGRVFFLFTACTVGRGNPPVEKVKQELKEEPPHESNFLY